MALGAVAAIVKADDLGLWLQATPDAAQAVPTRRAVGRGLLAALPGGWPGQGLFLLASVAAGVAVGFVCVPAFGALGKGLGALKGLVTGNS